VANELPRQALDQAGEPRQVGSSRIAGWEEIKPLYLPPGLVIEPPPVRIHASRRTKSHLPIAMNVQPEIAAAMVALGHELAVQELPGTLCPGGSAVSASAPPR
jgi:hypothetical protein